MKILYIALLLILCFTLSAMNDVADAYILPSHIQVKKGILLANTHGNLEYTVMYDAKKDTYAGIFLNKHFLSQDWICRNMDSRIAQFYFNKTSDCAGCKHKKVNIKPELYDED